MSYKLSKTEYNNTIKFNADGRYEYFVKKATKGLEIFIAVTSDNEPLLEQIEEDGNDIAVLPIWCHEDFVNNYINKKNLEGYKVQPITLAKFLEIWIPQLSQSNIEFAVFPLAFNTDTNIICGEDLLENFNETLE